MARRRDYHPYIDSYMDDIRTGKIPACKELHQAMDYIESKLDNPDVVIKQGKIAKAVELIERYFKFKPPKLGAFCYCADPLLLQEPGRGSL